MGCPVPRCTATYRGSVGCGRCFISARSSSSLYLGVPCPVPRASEAGLSLGYMGQPRWATVISREAYPRAPGVSRSRSPAWHRQDYGLGGLQRRVQPRRAGPCAALLFPVGCCPVFALVVCRLRASAASAPSPHHGEPTSALRRAAAQCLGWAGIRSLGQARIAALLGQGAVCCAQPRADQDRCLERMEHGMSRSGAAGICSRCL